jgi:hypothetical protein
MGYVIRGKVGFRSGNEELFEAATPTMSARGTRPSCTRAPEVVEVSPSEQPGRTMEVVTKNMEQMEASA